MKQFYNFHLVNPSPWPLTSSLGAFDLILYINFFIDGFNVLIVGLICLILSLESIESIFGILKKLKKLKKNEIF